MGIEKDIKSEIRDGRTVTAEIAQAAAQKIADDRKEKLTEEMVRSITNSEYLRKKKLLNLQKSRDLETVTKEALKKTSKLDDDLQKGNHTPESYQAERDSISKEENDETRKIDKEYYELYNQLDSQYPSMYRW